MKYTCSIFATMLASVCLSVGSIAQTPLTTTLIADGFSLPVFAVSPREDFSRMFVLELRGKIWVIESGVVLPTPFLDLSTVVQQTGWDQGLFSLAFHPDYASNGYFYVYYAGLSTNSVLERYQVTSDPNVADLGSASVLLDIPQPQDRHEGGTVMFGPDEYLYLALGDGGISGDFTCNGQNGLTLLAKMIRIDVDSAFPYAIPPDNPYVGDPNFLDEIWSGGFRNPWRFSFDRETGDIYLGDNGSSTREEIDFEPAGQGGRNYGWPMLEGSHCTGATWCPGSTPPCGAPFFSAPLYDYSHAIGCSVIGGFVYRGCAIPDLVGTYFFGDHCGGPTSGGIFSFRNTGGTVTEYQDRTNELRPDPLTIRSISSFGEDAYGELYILDHIDGELFKIVPVAAAADCDGDGIPDSCEIAAGVSQDCNANGVPDDCEITASTFCFCPSSSPCGNHDPEAGCGNSTGVGAVLEICGTGSVIADDLVLTCSQLPPNRPGIFYMGGAMTQISFGNGLRCVGTGGVGLFRYAAINSGASGQTTLGPGTVAESVVRFGPAGHITAGQTWNFQYWFRDPSDPCGGGFNLSNGASVSFTP